MAGHVIGHTNAPLSPAATDRSTATTDDADSTTTTDPHRHRTRTGAGTEPEQALEREPLTTELPAELDPENEGPTVSDDQKLTQESPPAVTSAFVAHVIDPFDPSIGT